MVVNGKEEVKKAVLCESGGNCSSEGNLGVDSCVPGGDTLFTSLWPGSHMPS